ncbi:winged helix-turn-helix domain-containing protein [Streptomyces sp. WAC06614]|uniref:ArsR/SmtB family transcription factor n=1 Tax=Streptomyces sp. WAC06614 TaxID=2487416 RepID=UPI0028AB8218|nr:winged helix-turn-helix domain-containing protein [Streptomyces sp. WAC06614]
MAAGLDRVWLRELIPPTGYVPDFLTPVPAGPAPSPAAERDAIPSVFTGPGLRTSTRPADPPQLACPARGVGTLGESRPTVGAPAPVPVLGRSRTLLLTEPASPASTTEPARRTGPSPAGVSQCLTALRDAGLVSAHRAGRRVLYARTSAAETLLAAAGGPPTGRGPAGGPSPPVPARSGGRIGSWADCAGFHRDGYMAGPLRTDHRAIGG